jgi:hypothetical protein
MAREEIVHMGDEIAEENEDCLAVGHDEVMDFEDEDVWQGHCARCGAELFEDRS